jgi:hypothetical protein
MRERVTAIIKFQKNGHRFVSCRSMVRSGQYKWIPPHRTGMGRHILLQRER